MARKDTKTSREPTRRQVARSRKEREKHRLIYYSLGGVGLLILLVLGFGLVQTYVLEPNAPVAIVDDTEISTGEYRDRVQYERFLLDDQLLQIQEQLAALPEPTEEDQFSQMVRNQYQQFANQILQLRSQVDRQTVDDLIEDQLVQQEAAERGLTVTEEEVTETINRIVASRAGALTEVSVQETSTAVAAATSTAAVWTPTPTFTPSPTLTTTESITPTATPADTPTPAPTPTPNVLAGEDLSQQYQNWLITLENEVGIGEETYRSYIRNDLLEDKVRDAIGEEVPTEAEQARARHILVETEEEAQAVIDRLDSGEAFADVAEDVSVDTGSAAQGGDLGFVPPGQFVGPVDEAVFSRPIGEIGEPVQSQFGWHIIEVLEREVRELSPQAYQQQQQQAYTEWLSQARSEAQIEDLWTEDKAPDDQF